MTTSEWFLSGSPGTYLAVIFFLMAFLVVSWVVLWLFILSGAECHRDLQRERDRSADFRRDGLASDIRLQHATDQWRRVEQELDLLRNKRDLP